MRTTLQSNTHAIRFRRWSRAGYAVFCSLSANVTIGRVGVSIADKSLQKTVSVSSPSRVVSFRDEESPELVAGQEELEARLLETTALMLSVDSTDKAAACSLPTLYFYQST
ncbi:MAG TPA: hypothetical protein VK152_09075 [Paludibacter sp.]|nr:hypothetical protein [Paludibacter sp.]